MGCLVACVALHIGRGVMGIWLSASGQALLDDLCKEIDARAAYLATKDPAKAAAMTMLGTFIRWEDPFRCTQNDLIHDLYEKSCKVTGAHQYVLLSCINFIQFNRW